MGETAMMLALVNAVFSIGVSVIAFCRMVALNKCTCVFRVTPFALMLGAGLVSATRPWLNLWPSEADVFITFAVFVYIYSTKPGCTPRT